MRLELVEQEKLGGCEGFVFRYRENNFIGADGRIVVQKSFHKLKRLSCPGCDKCWWIYETLAEDISCGCLPEISGHPVAEGIYQLVFRPGGTDYETGCVDSWEWDFVLVEPN